MQAAARTARRQKLSPVLRLRPEMLGAVLDNLPIEEAFLVRGTSTRFDEAAAHMTVVEQAMVASVTARARARDVAWQPAVWARCRGARRVTLACESPASLLQVASLATDATRPWEVVELFLAFDRGPVPEPFARALDAVAQELSRQTPEPLEKDLVRRRLNAWTRALLVEGLRASGDVD